MLLNTACVSATEELPVSLSNQWLDQAMSLAWWYLHPQVVQEPVWKKVSRCEDYTAQAGSQEHTQVSDMWGLRRPEEEVALGT